MSKLEKAFCLFECCIAFGLLGLNILYAETKALKGECASLHVSLFLGFVFLWCYTIAIIERIQKYKPVFRFGWLELLLTLWCLGLIYFIMKLSFGCRLPGLRHVSYYSVLILDHFILIQILVCCNRLYVQCYKPLATHSLFIEEDEVWTSVRSAHNLSHSSSFFHGCSVWLESPEPMLI